MTSQTRSARWVFTSMGLLAVLGGVLCRQTAINAAALSSVRIYSAAGDFTTTQNPNGPWSYGSASTNLSTFAPYTTGASSTRWGATVPSIELADDHGRRSLILVPNWPTLFSPTHRVPIVRWSAPSDGRWDVVGDWTAQNAGNTLVSLVIRRLTSAMVESRGELLTDTVPKPFSFVAALGKDDRVEFSLRSPTVGAALRVEIRPHRFDFMTLDYPGAASTLASGVDSHGDIVGEYIDTAGTSHGYFKTGAGFRALNYPGAAGTSARGVNDYHMISGRYQTAVPLVSGAKHAFVYGAAGYRPFDIPGAADTAVTGMNNMGDLTGLYDLGDLSTGIGFFSRYGRATSFEVPGSLPLHTVPQSINDPGLVVGYFWDPLGAIHGFVKRETQFTTIDYPGASATSLRGINNQGDIVGDCATCINGRPHGLFLKSGAFEPVDFPVVDAQTLARAINRFGVIVGQYQRPGEPVHGFIAKPALP